MTRIASLQELKNFAINFAPTVKTGMILALIGDLGSGKTTFTRELVKALHHKDQATSPTFVICQTYSGTPIIYHYDLYRLSIVDDLTDIGAEEHFPAQDGITIVEWADKIPDLLPPETIWIKFNYIDEHTREITLLGERP